MHLYLASQQKLDTELDQDRLKLEELKLTEDLMVYKPSEVTITQADIQEFKEQERREQQAYA